MNVNQGHKVLLCSSLSFIIWRVIVSLSSWALFCWDARLLLPHSVCSLHIHSVAFVSLGSILISHRYLEMYSFFLDFLNYQYIFIGISYSPAFQFYLCNTVFFSSFSFLPSPSFWSFWQYVNRLSFHRINSSCHYFDFYCVNFWSALLMCVDGSFCPGPVVIQTQTHTQTFINKTSPSQRYTLTYLGSDRLFLLTVNRHTDIYTQWHAHGDTHRYIHTHIHTYSGMHTHRHINK